MMETKFGRQARAIPFTRRQIELIIGSLLGDATLLKTTSGYCFRVHHGIVQRSLVDWKYAALRDYVRTAPRNCGSGYYFRTVTHAEITPLRTEFYVAGRKIIPLSLLREYLTEFVLAVWIMDDGAAERFQLRLNTQSFTREECDAVATLMKDKFDVVFTLNSDKGCPRLRCRSGSMPHLIDIVRPYMLPEMLYKLGGMRCSPPAGAFGANESAGIKLSNADKKISEPCRIRRAAFDV